MSDEHKKQDRALAMAAINKGFDEAMKFGISGDGLHKESPPLCLLPALRQYSHNMNDEFVWGYDLDEIH